MIKQLTKFTKYKKIPKTKTTKIIWEKKQARPNRARRMVYWLQFLSIEIKLSYWLVNIQLFCMMFIYLLLLWSLCLKNQTKLCDSIWFRRLYSLFFSHPFGLSTRCLLAPIMLGRIWGWNLEMERHGKRFLGLFLYTLTQHPTTRNLHFGKMLNHRYLFV